MRKSWATQATLSSITKVLKKKWSNQKCPNFIKSVDWSNCDAQKKWFNVPTSCHRLLSEVGGSICSARTSIRNFLTFKSLKEMFEARPTSWRTQRAPCRHLPHQVTSIRKLFRTICRPRRRGKTRPSVTSSSGLRPKQKVWFLLKPIFWTNLPELVTSTMTVISFRRFWAMKNLSNRSWI